MAATTASETSDACISPTIELSSAGPHLSFAASAGLTSQSGIPSRHRLLFNVRHDGPTSRKCPVGISIRASRGVLFFGRVAVVAVHARRQPILAESDRWADPRVAGNSGVTQGLHIRPILIDPCVYLIGSADGPVAGDEDRRERPRYSLTEAAVSP